MTAQGVDNRVHDKCTLLLLLWNCQRLQVTIVGKGGLLPRSRRGYLQVIISKTFQEFEGTNTSCEDCITVCEKWFVSVRETCST